MDWVKKKILSDLRNTLDHGHLLFIEENDPKTQFDEFKWYKAMMNEENYLKIYVNAGGFQGISNDSVPIQINIHKLKTLKELKDKIGLKINHSPGEFILRR